MSDTALLENAVSRIFSDYYTGDILLASKQAGWCAELWQALQEAGMTLVSVPEELGGHGGTMQDAACVVRLAGKYCASVPLADTAMLGGWALAQAGLSVPAHPLAFAVASRSSALTIDRSPDGNWRLTGILKHVPWGRFAETLVLVAEFQEQTVVIPLRPSQYSVTPGSNLAGEARDDIAIEGLQIGDAQVAVGPAGVTVDIAQQRGATARALMMSGALDCILDMTVRYAKQRVQFGRPLIKFQAIQQELAKLAGDSAIATACAVSAAASLDTTMQAFDVAVAKIRAGEAAQSGSLIAHQVHGAMGVTEDYLLHHSTLRLWSWRSEFGSEAQWSNFLGKMTVSHGSQWLWNLITEH